MKTISIYKSELCWLEHRTYWNEHDYKFWKSWAKNRADGSMDYLKDYYRALTQLIKDLTWDEAATRFAKNDDLTLEYTTTDADGQTVTATVSLINELENAMGDDAWSEDYEIGECIDTMTEYEYSGFEEEGK